MSLIKDMPEVEGRLVENRALDSLSWLRVGGPAEVLFTPAHLADLARFMKALPDETPVLPIGVCSNLIIRDGGVRGVVVRLGPRFNGFEVLKAGEVRVGASALDAQVAKKAAEAGIDFAFLRTIPGSIGGAIRMNAGCYGTYTEDHFVQAQAITREGVLMNLGRDDLNFRYRQSDLPDGAVIISATFAPPGGDPDTLHRRMTEQLRKRDETQPTKDRSAGSTFRNPAGFSSTGQTDDVHDLKAWKVIDDAGMRGAMRGGAQMSQMHSNFLINTGNATAADLEGLGEEVRKKVYENSGIRLEWEIMRIGEN